MPPGIGYGPDAVMRQRPQPRERRFDMSMGIPPAAGIDSAIQGMQGQLGFGGGVIPGTGGQGMGQPFSPGGMSAPLTWGGGPMPPSGPPPNFDTRAMMGAFAGLDPERDARQAAWAAAGSDPNMSGRAALAGLPPKADMLPGRAAPPGWRPGQGNIPPEFLGLPPQLSVGPLPVGLSPGRALAPTPVGGFQPGSGGVMPVNNDPGFSTGQGNLTPNPNIPPQLKAIFDRLSASGSDVQKPLRVDGQMSPPPPMGGIGADAKFQPVTGGGLKAGPAGSMQGGTANWTPEPPPSRPKVKARSKDRPNSGDKSGVGVLKRQDAVKKRQKRLMKVTA